MSLSALSPWVLHLSGSLLGAGLAWALGIALHRLLRLSTATPRYWLGIWLLAVVPPLLAVALATAAPMQLAALPAPLSLPIALDEGAAGGTTIPAPMAGLGWPSLTHVALAAYLGVATVLLLRLLGGMRSAARIVRLATPVADSAWPGRLSGDTARQLADKGIALRVTGQAMTPFAVRWPHPTVVMPADALLRFNDRQLRLVLRHEAAHLSRRDPQRAAVMAVTGVLLWFNPFVRLIAARVQMAVELHCDAEALQGDDDARRDFASAYLQALRMAGHGGAPTALNALTHREVAGHRLRILHMLQGDGARRLPRAACALLGAGALAAGAMLTLAQAVAANTPAQIVAVAGIRTTTATGGALRIPPPLRFAAPLAQARITGQFGDTGGIRQRAHRGTDFSARVGTPVLAPADGTVLIATDAYPEGPQYGTVVVLDHGNGWQTLFAHLDATDVQAGQRVRGGQQIARSGSSGRVTGPHLHMEMLRHGERVDPQHHLN